MNNPTSLTQKVIVLEYGIGAPLPLGAPLFRGAPGALHLWGAPSLRGAARGAPYDIPCGPLGLYQCVIKLYGVF